MFWAQGKHSLYPPHAIQLGGSCEKWPTLWHCLFPPPLPHAEGSGCKLQGKSGWQDNHMEKQLFFQGWVTLVPDQLVGPTNPAARPKYDYQEELRTEMLPLLVPVMKDQQRHNTVLHLNSFNPHRWNISVATTCSLLNPPLGNPINTALFSATLTSKIDAPCPVETKSLENEVPFTSFVYFCIYTLRSQKGGTHILKCCSCIFC